MNQKILFLLLTATLPAVAQSAPANSTYTTWCERTATAEKVSPEEWQRHVAACVEALEEADRNPDKPKKRDEEG